MSQTHFDTIDQNLTLGALDSIADQKSYGYLESIISNLPLGIAILEGPEFRYYRINSFLADLNLLPIEDHIGKTLSEVLHDAAKFIAPRLNEVYKTKKPSEPFEFSVKLPRDPNRERHLVDSFFPITNDSGKMTAIGVIVQDITQQKNMDIQIKNHLKQLTGQKLALDQFAIVAETDLKGRITYANDQFCRISKYSRDELIGRDHRDVVNSGFHPKLFWRKMWTTLNKGKIWRADVKNRAKDGSIYWVDTSIVPICNENGKPEKYLAIRAEITRRKDLEENLKSSNVILEDQVKKRTKVLRVSEKELKKQKKELEEKNIALKVVLTQIELDKQRMKDDVMSNLETIVLPTLDKFRLKGASKKHIDQHRKSLNSLTTSFGSKISDKKVKLTPREIEVCNLVKHGNTNKEIAELISISVHTVEEHRRTARKKLGISNKDINLNTYLNSL